jgi:hypothetical protein
MEETPPNINESFPLPSSPTLGKVFAAIAKAQRAMGPALKGAINPHLKSKYADLASVQAACIPALNEAGLAVIQAPEVNGSSVKTWTIFGHAESGEWIGQGVNITASKADAQGIGSAITYGARYGLARMAGIQQEDDDGNAGVGNAVPVKPTVSNAVTVSAQPSKQKPFEQHVEEEQWEHQLEAVERIARAHSKDGLMDAAKWIASKTPPEASAVQLRELVSKKTKQLKQA